MSNNLSSGIWAGACFATGNLAVNPFDTLYIYVGGHGQSSTYGPAVEVGMVVVQVTSSSGEPGNGGGGASDVRYGDTTLNHRVIVWWRWWRW